MSLKKPAIELFRRLGYEVVPTSRVMPRDIAGHFKTLFELLDITCVFDVGANIGQYGQLLRDEVGFRGWIVSFEPVNTPRDVLRDKSRGDPTGWCINAPLGRERRQLTQRHERGHAFVVPGAGQFNNGFSPRTMCRPHRRGSGKNARLRGCGATRATRSRTGFF